MDTFDPEPLLIVELRIWMHGCPQKGRPPTSHMKDSLLQNKFSIGTGQGPQSLMAEERNVPRRGS
jgi:hypothetical protein